ncbi:methionyl-tRNA formyltransferase [bacterium]|nr:methionyl-tRNA formyltransferase [bacterium]
MKVLFYGTPQFAVPTLERLLESKHEVVAVVTQPDKPSGRGMKLTASPVKVLAVSRGIPVLQPQSVKTEEFHAEIAKFAPDVAVVVAYGKILPRRVLDVPRHGSLNVHASLLPGYRGAAPIQWAIIRGETKTGVAIMQMDEGMDTGAVVDMREVPILEDDDTVSLGHMLSYTGAEAMVQTLDRLAEEGSLAATPQEHDKATYAPLIKREMARIDWTQAPEQLLCHIRGFQLWPKAFTALGAIELKITGADACSADWVPASAFDDRVAPGTIVEVFKGRGFAVRTGGERGVITITRVQPPGKPEMGAFDFLNGGGAEVGKVLGQ